MISLLSRLFIKHHNNIEDPAVRRAYGILCGAVGIILNLFICTVKLIAATLCGSVAIAADAINNLSDAGSSLITMIGFHLSGQKPDPAHPFGHGRGEYISGFVVAMLILMMGFTMISNALDTIIKGSETVFSITAVIILGLSILIKFYMYLYNSRLGKRLNAASLKATGIDSLGDCLSTALVLIATVLSRFTSFAIDGWCGLAIALFILYSGLRTAKETLDPLLGTPPEKEFVERIHTIVLSYPEVKGIHDLIVHNYGPGRIMISLHAEVSQSADILISHDVIDRIERHLNEELSCHTTIHMDPVAVGDPTIAELKEKVASLAAAIHPAITLHDFRMVVGQTHTNLIFDLAVPYTLQRTEEEIKEEMARLVRVLDPHYLTVIQIDRSYVE